MLVSKLRPDSDLKLASTVAIGSIAMHGIRRANLKLGEQCVVVGAGIIGLISIQLLVKSGVRVCAIDLDPQKLELASKFGAELSIEGSSNLFNTIHNWTGGVGADAVIITAGTTSNQVISDAFQMCRRKGKVTLVGSVGMNLNRSDMYSKEIDLQISTSYGPGRYDDQYEKEGNDYPISYVRWTEGRNMKEYLRLIDEEVLNLEEMVTRTVPFKDAKSAFKKNTQESALNLFTFLEYYPELVHERIDLEEYGTARIKKDKIGVGLLGAGAFAKNMMLPNIEKVNAFEIISIYNRSGVKSKNLADNYKNATYAASAEEIFTHSSVDLVIITTNHASHADYILSALKKGKHVFVEKPLAISQEEVDHIKEFYIKNTSNAPKLVVGFNRRFSPLVTALKEVSDQRINPMMLHYRMNAGHLPHDHWVHGDGGRIIGEACHIIDLMRFIVGYKMISISYDYISPANEHISSGDNRAITIKFEDGSIAQIQYFSVGSRALAKEYLEAHFDQKSAVIDDFKSLETFGFKVKSKTYKTSNKGHAEMMEKVASWLKNGHDWLIPLEELIEITEATLEIAKD